MFKRLAISLVVCSTIGFFIRWYTIGRKYKNKKSLKGKVIIVTGGSSGIGFEVCKELALKYEATVILAGRSTVNGRIAVSEIHKINQEADVRFEQLDLSSFLSICGFVKKINRIYPEVYALVNNAAIFYHPPTLTKDGFEITFQTNYLGPFLLTQNLLPLLKNSKAGARIVNLSSNAQSLVKEFPQIDYHLAYQDCAAARIESYAYSKFCLVLWSLHLSSSLESEQSNITVHCVDPGNVETNIFRNFPLLSNPVWFWLQKPIRIWCIKTPYEGAQGIFLALLEDNPSEFYYKHLKPAAYNPLCESQEASQSLWRMSKIYCSAWIN